jgi:hypothetical protein
MSARTTLLALLAALAVAGPRLRAQATPTTPSSKRIIPTKEDQDSALASGSAGKLAAYYAIPETPATTFLGASAAQITRPVTPKDLLVSLLDGVDAAGKARQGFALEASLSLLPNLTVTPEEYRRGGFNVKYLLSNTLLSLATAQ